MSVRLKGKMGLKRSVGLILICFSCIGCAVVPYRPSALPPAGVYHIVGSGQTLYRISKAYGVDIRDIMRVNDIRDPNQIGVGESIFIPGAHEYFYIEPYRPTQLKSVENIVGKKQYRVKWLSITLHHSGTKEGNAEAFDRNHRVRGMGGLFYHFVIGNGSGSGDGEIEVGWRWRRQAEVERAKDIQICLVGDFNKQEVSREQFDSLVKLIKVLQQQYHIPAAKIRRHKDINGKVTECPGADFCFSKIIAALRKS